LLLCAMLFSWRLRESSSGLKRLPASLGSLRAVLSKDSFSNLWKKEKPKADTWLRFHKRDKSKIADQKIAPATDFFEMPTWRANFYMGRKYMALNSSQGLGIVVGVPVQKRWRLEFEAEWRDGGVNYKGTRFDFEQASSGGTLQYLPFSGSVQPYVGFGVVGLYAGKVSPLALQSRWVGVAQIVAGSNVYLNESVSFGVQGTVLSAPIDERVSGEAIASRPDGSVRVLGTVGIKF